MTSAAKKCPKCGAAIRDGTADGLCLRCLGSLAFSEEPAEAAPNTKTLLRLGNYDLLEEIARGGMGVVYRARQLNLNRVVALKVLLTGPFSSPDFVRRFRQEAEIVARLRHPNIVSIHEIGEHDGHHYLSLEYVAGQNFSMLARERPLSANRAAKYVKVIAEAVAYAHRCGVLHRDLKPSNILLDDLDQPRVTDFGLATLVHADARLTVTGQVLGSPNYMPPEQAAGKLSPVTAAADIYSLGAILYELLTGHAPFQAETIQAVLLMVESVPPVPLRRLNPDTPVDLQTICLKCLQKDPARRYPTAQALADDLGRFLAGRPIAARPVPLGERVVLWCRRHPLPAALAAGCLLAVTLGILGVLREWRAAESHAQGELRQRLLAERNAAESRSNLYAADIAVAARVLEDGDYGRARRTLAQLRPQNGEPDLRGFEWRYLWHLCQGDELTTLSGHHGTVTCAAFSPDGRLLATGGQDGLVNIWSPARRKLIITLNLAPTVVWSVAFAGQGDYLVTACNRNIQFWNTRDWQAVKTFPGHLAALTDSGNLLVTAEASPFFWEPAGPVRLFNWRTGKLLRQLGQPGRSVALSHDGRLLAVAGDKSGVQVLTTAGGMLVRQCATEAPVWSLDFEPDGRRLLSTGWSTEVSIWPVNSHGPPQQFSAAALHVWSAVFSRDGLTIATTGSDQAIRFWDAKTLRLQAALHGHGGEVWCAAFSPDNRMLATGGKDQQVLLWPVTPPAQGPVFPNDKDIWPVFSSDGQWLVTTTPDSSQKMLWNLETGVLTASNLAANETIVAFAPTNGYVSVAPGEFKLKRWPALAGQPPREIPLEVPPGFAREFSRFGLAADRQRFFAIDVHGAIGLWRADTGKWLRTMHGPDVPTRYAVLSPHGKLLAVCSESEDIVRLYDCDTGHERELAGHRDFVSGLDFSPDDAVLASSSMDGTIRLWRAADGLCLGVLPGHLTEATGVSFSPDGRTLASFGRNESVKLWHVATGRELLSLREPDAGNWIKFSPDGHRLAVGTVKDSARMLEAPGD